jgi:hypothetical protein
MIQYTKSKIKNLKSSFDGIEKVNQNYSQSYQDMFVLTMLNGKLDGTFLEIGAHHPTFLSNTFLLESTFGWNGISIDIEPICAQQFNQRKTNIVIADALTIDYSELLKNYNMSSRIDYLQIDIEPSINTFNCLKRIPLSEYRFSVITYETDYYDTNTPKELKDEIRAESRRILQDYGYLLIVGDVCNLGNDPFEDWYVDPEVVDEQIINLYKNRPDFNDISENFFFK